MDLFISEILNNLIFSSFYKSLYQNLYIEGMIVFQKTWQVPPTPLNSTIILKW